MVGVKEKKKEGGLAGIVAGDSSICLCSAADESLLYRGFSIDDLAENGSFEETAWLLLRGNLPTPNELSCYNETLYAERLPPSLLKEVLEKIPPHTHLMDVLRTSCSFLGHLEPELPSLSRYKIADRLIAVLPSCLLYWFLFHTFKKPPTLNSEEKSLAGRFLSLLHKEPGAELQIKALNTSLILYAEHEFNASTFTVRTIASTLSDFYSAICGGIGALRGELHGGANEHAIGLIRSFTNEKEAENGVRRLLQDKKLIMGFGHRVYTRADPRSSVIKYYAKTLSFHHEDSFLFPIAERIEKIMWEEKQLFPNLDFYSALVYHYLNIPPAFFTPLFVFARISGWSAHLLEQRDHNKLIRPLSHYIGPEKKIWIPQEKRSAS